MLKFKDFLSELKISLKPNTAIDISSLNKMVKSFNHKTQQVEFKKIIKVIRKNNAKTFIVKTTNNSLECSIDHKFSTSLDLESYKTVEEIINEGFHNVSIFTPNGFEPIVNITPTYRNKNIYDLEVEDNHNLFTNNLLSHNSMGDPTTVSGGTAIPFYAHCRIRVTRSEIDRELGQNVMKFTIIKNKMAAPFKVGTVVYKWNCGFDFSSEIAQLAIEFGIIKNEKTSYFLPETDIKLIGKKKVIAHLDDNPEYTKAVLEPAVLKYLESTELRKDEISENELY